VKEIKISNPTGCHLYENNNKPTREQLRNDLEQVVVYENSSHLFRALKKCTQCGQLYFYEFHEIVDWEDGNDAQFVTWIPVDDEESGRKLSEMNVIEINKYSGIRSDFPSDASEPGEPHW
jgi:hypothetical protein